MTRFKPKSPEEFGFQELIYEKKNDVARVTIHRPKVYNAISKTVLEEMILAFRDASWDDAIAVVVLTGAGDQAFCSGGDVNEYAAEYLKRPRDYWKWGGLFIEAVDLFRNIGKPTIARLNGFVAGGGNEFNLAADLAIAADHVKIMQVGTRVGSVAAMGATQWLPLVIGDRRAREMLFTCEPISAQQAFEWGLVNEVVAYRELDDAVERWSRKLVDKFPECMRYTKQQLNFWKDLAWNLTVGHARDWLTLHYTSPEPMEGMKAFVEKRPPDHAAIRRRWSEDQSPEFLWGSPAKSCASCGAQNLPRGFSFCGRCGQKLSE